MPNNTLHKRQRRGKLSFCLPCGCMLWLAARPRRGCLRWSRALSDTLLCSTGVLVPRGSPVTDGLHCTRGLSHLQHRVGVSHTHCLTPEMPPWELTDYVRQLSKMPPKLCSLISFNKQLGFPSCKPSTNMNIQYIYFHSTCYKWNLIVAESHRRHGFVFVYQ